MNRDHNTSSLELCNDEASSARGGGVGGGAASAASATSAHNSKDPNIHRLEMTLRRSKADAPPDSQARMQTLRTFTMARVAESLRFDFEDDEMECVVTKELLTRIVLRANAARIHEPEAVILAEIERLSTILEAIGPWDATFNDLLDVECPNFPETTHTQRERLKQIASECEIVTKSMICRTFGVAPDSQLIEFLFSSGAEALPSEVFQDIVGTLETHPFSQPFNLDFTEQMVASGRKMMTLLPFVILVIVSLAIIPTIANIEYHEMIMSVMDVLDDDWDNGCPDGPTSILGCNFIQRSLSTIETVEFDALRYFRTELIGKLWPDDGRSAATTPIGHDESIGSSFAVGALVLRLAAEKSAEMLTSASCEALNLSTATIESRVFSSFGCGAVWSAVIPFNATKEEALALAATATTSMPRMVDSALIAQFGTYEPTTAVAAYFKITLALPRGGHVLTRVEANPVDYDAHKAVLPLLIINALVFLLSLGFAIFYGTRGQSFVNVDLVCDLVLLILVSIAYGLLMGLPAIEVYQIAYANPQQDEAANRFATAVRILAFWVLMMIGLLARYLQEVGALYIVIAIIRYAALELMALVVIFGIWTLSFALMANLFFGAIAVEHASNFSSFAFLFQFFSGGGSYETLAARHQLLGPIFWFVFSVFVIFLALNLLIAVLTAPLAEVKETCDLHLIMHAKVQVEIQMDHTLTPWQRNLEHLRELALPFITLIYDSSPSPPLKLYALQLNQALKGLCSVHSHANPRLAMACGADFLSLLNREAANVPFQTRLANNVFKSNELDEYSLAFTLQAISSMSANTLVRDARLEKALMLYDIHTTNTQKLQEKQESSREVAAKLSSIDVDSPFASFEVPTRESTEHGSVLFKAGAQSLSAADPAVATEGTQVFSCEDEEVQKDAAGAGSANPLASGFSQVGAAAEAPANTVTSMEVKSDANEVEQADFLFTKYLLKRLRRARLFAVQFVILSIVFTWFFATGLSRDNSSAYLVGSIENGLVTFPLHQACDDGNCTSAMSFKKTFLEVGNLPEWFDFMDKTFKRQLFLAPKLGLAPPNSTAVLWDRRITYELPIFVRQLQAVPKPCTFPATRHNRPEIDDRRRKLMETYNCTKRGVFSEVDMAPLETMSPLLSPSILKFQNTCAERRKIGYWGVFEMLYPCAGHIAEINSEAELDALLQSGWISKKTRLIAVTVTYRSGETAVEHTLYTGVGASGAVAASNTLSTAISENRSELDNMLIVVMVCLSMDAIIEIVSYIYQHFTSSEKVELQISEILPRQLLFVYFLVLIVPYIAFPQPAFNERVKLQLGLASLCLTFMATNVVFFPIAGLFSKQATLLFDTLGRSARQIALIAPFYAIFILALAMSGLLLFSSRVPEFSSLRFAIQTVARGALGDLDKDALAAPLPELAEVYNIIFYAVILIMLANLVLAMVTSAASDAMGAPLPVELAERVCKAFEWHVMYGSLIEFVIAWNIFFLRKSNQSAGDTYREMSTIATGDGKRLPYLSETLCVSLGPNRANDVLKQLRLDSVASSLYPSTMLMILEQHHYFHSAFRIEEALDDEKEREMVNQFQSPSVSFSTTTAQEAMLATIHEPRGAISEKLLISPAADHHNHHHDSVMDVDVIE